MSWFKKSVLLAPKVPETDAIATLEGLGFADVNIVYRKHMDAVLVAQKHA